MNIKPGRVVQKIVVVISLYPLLLAGLSFVHLLAPQRQGVLALSQIGAPYLFIPLLALVPLALRRDSWPLGWGLLLCGAIFCYRFAPSIVSLPTSDPPAGTATISVLTWNTLYRNDAVDNIRNTLDSKATDIIALQELSPRQARAIMDDEHLMQRYPYHILQPDEGSRGMGLLSVYPIVEHGRNREPNVLWARVQLEDGKSIAVVSAHPVASELKVWHRLPIVYGYDPTHRDQQLKGVRDLIIPFMTNDDPLLLVGDFNVTEREPAYQDLTTDLIDAHAAVGWGMGNTWRGRPHWPFAVVRIDYLFSNKHIVPIHVTTDCTRRGSDHCIVSGIYGIR